MNIDRAIKSAFLHYRTGNLDRAEHICKKILLKKPKNIELINLLGIIYYQIGNYTSAMQYFQRVVQLEPNAVNAYIGMGKTLRAMRQPDEALKYYQKALFLDPESYDAYIGTGIICKEQGKPEEAIIWFQKALNVNPHMASAYNNLGVVFADTGRLNDAVENFKKAVELDPAFTNAYIGLGKALQDDGEIDKAFGYIKKALQLSPNNAKALNNMGTILQYEGRLDEAIEFYQKALKITPEYYEAYYNLGGAFKEKNEIHAAISCFRQAIRINPAFIEAYNNLGKTLAENGRLGEAKDSFHRALEINPDDAYALTNLGWVLKEQGSLGGAEACCRKALAIKPDLFPAYSNLLGVMSYNSSYDAGTIFSEHVRFGRLFAEPLSSFITPHTNEPAASRRLKVGYISPDFRQHSVAYFIEPVMSAHNRENFEVFCYTNSFVRDSVTKRIRGYADHWRDVTRTSDEKLAELIRNDAIDILVDLAGHTANNRLLLFARKPAPVLVSWIGYPATTGFSAMDYKIVDYYTDPSGVTDHYYTEELIRMPDSFLCYMPAADSPTVGTLPAMQTEFITFGSFNNFVKISPEVIGVWTKILRMVPDSRLILKSMSLSDEETVIYAKDLFKKEGVPESRMEILSWETSTGAHLSLYNRIDIGLDTFPYNGTTTTCEALWMGVPVVTLAGKTHASRVGVSILSNLGLQDLIAKTKYEYAEIAVQLANDLQKLTTLRRNLRKTLLQSPICDARQFTADLEERYRKIWERWCKSV